MDKKISELFDYGDEIVAAGEIDDMFDPQEIKELTMNKIHNEKTTHHIKRPAAVILAAALTALLGLTALAAYQFSAADRFDGYFEELTVRQEEVINQIGVGEMPAVTANGTTVTPLAAIGDEGFYYLRLRFTAPEGTVLNIPDEEAGNLVFWGAHGEGIECFLTDADGEKYGYSFRTTWIDETPDDNELDVIIKLISQYNAGVHFDAGESVVLTISGLWLETAVPGERDEWVYTKLLDGPWSFDLGKYGAVSMRELDVDGLPIRRLVDGEIVEMEDMSMTLRSLRVSPLSIGYSYDLTSPDAPDHIPGSGTIHAVMKDGTIICTSWSGDASITKTSCSGHVPFDAPVDVNEIDYIQFGDRQIKVNS